MNLAILNMLPIPVLDGGHIVLAIIEAVRRKPVNMQVLEFVQTACAVLIIGYMALHQLLRYRRSLRERSGSSAVAEAQPRATPKPPSWIEFGG